MNNNKIEKENEQSEFTNHEEEVCKPADPVPTWCLSVNEPKRHF